VQRILYTDKSITTAAAYGPCQFSSAYLLYYIRSVKNGEPQSKTQRYGKTRSTTMRLPRSGRRFIGGGGGGVLHTPLEQPNRENNPSSLRDRHRYRVLYLLLLEMTRSKSSVGFYYIIIIIIIVRRSGRSPPPPPPSQKEKRKTRTYRSIKQKRII